MKARGFQTNNTNLIDPTYNYHPLTFNKEWWNDWEVTDKAVEINLERIKDRILMKSGWYKFWGIPINCFEDILNTSINERKIDG